MMLLSCSVVPCGICTLCRGAPCHDEVRAICFAQTPNVVNAAKQCGACPTCVDVCRTRYDVLCDSAKQFGYTVKIGIRVVEVLVSGNDFIGLEPKQQIARFGENAMNLLSAGCGVWINRRGAN